MNNAYFESGCLESGVKEAPGPVVFIGYGEG